jgi:hypothetical protein
MTAFCPVCSLRLCVCVCVRACVRACVRRRGRLEARHVAHSLINLVADVACNGSDFIHCYHRLCVDFGEDAPEVQIRNPATLTEIQLAKHRGLVSRAEWFS